MYRYEVSPPDSTLVENVESITLAMRIPFCSSFFSTKKEEGKKESTFHFVRFLFHINERKKCS